MSQHQHIQPERLLDLVQQLFNIESIDVEDALGQAASLVVEVLGADKADVFLFQEQSQTLVALGVSHTPLGRKEQAIGMHRLQIANGGRTVDVFQTGKSYHNGRVDQDVAELPGIKHGLRIHSVVAVPLLVGGERRGVLQVDWLLPDMVTEQEQQFLEGVAHWIGIIVHRGELLQQITGSAAQEARRATAEELVTVLAHDFRNYLTPLKARVGLLTRRAKKEQRQQDLNDLASINTTMRRFEGMITDLMDIARLSQGLFVLTKQPFDLAQLSHEMASTLRTPTINITVEMPDELIIFGDADRIRQALENLLSNAIKHALKNTAVILHAETREQNNSLLISVTNQGPGIPAKLQASLFEPFHADVSSTGLGLGLFLAQQIAKAHGGDLTLDKTYRLGARFLLELPLGDEH